MARWLVAFLVVLWAGIALAKVSPGPLSAAHAALEGAAHCADCHAKGERAAATDQRCLSCHREIGALQMAGRGLHARTRGTCASCHSEHRGRDAKLIAWGGAPETFDHARAGWPLDGEHAKLECRTCHTPALQRSPVATLLRVKDHSRSWLGLDRSCWSCHDDPHRWQLGSECRSCHTTTAWKPAARFDHARTAYPLTGAHARVACAGCHGSGAPQAASAHGAPPRPRSAAGAEHYKPIAHAECSSCHRDAHAGKLGAQCSGCHQTTSFAAVRAVRFDHERTRFPLRGRHARLACASCHDPANRSKVQRFAQCADCHRDAHGGTATIAGKAADCAACHDEKGFRPSTFPIAAHQQTGYPLDGAHVRAACASCHGKQPKDASLGTSRTVMHPPGRDCASCHGDPHGGRFAAGGRRARAGGCLSCHTMERFAPSTYGVAAHAAAAFPLEGAHRTLACATCHREMRAEMRPTSAAPAQRTAEARAMPFADPRRVCADCHRTPHGRQFAARRGGESCESCHSVGAFTPASRFDHGRDAAFRLTGAHAQLACAACHKPERDPDGVSRTRWRPLEPRCESCHSARAR